MFQVRVEASFAAAHFLKNYHGKCESLHGHNYKVYAHVKGNRLDEGGMLVDFGILKETLRSVCAKLDHSNLNDLKDSKGNDVFFQNPSAERIAKWIFDQIEATLQNTEAQLFAVDVFETETSRARYSIDF
ncbi:MAG: 6-carboxytetrahydropterin synthase QueD [Spirochaetaceae bacterium]|nr:6-carboxytetrahydropterin synthase QueD [Spirochaetaceae bacterium]